MTVVIIGILISLFTFFGLYIFSTFKYEISEKDLTIKWRLLKCIPFNSRKIDFDNIQAIRKFIFKKDILYPTEIWGNLFIKKGFIVILKAGFIKRAYITPDYPDLFVGKVRRMK